MDGGSVAHVIKEVNLASFPSEAEPWGAYPVEEPLKGRVALVTGSGRGLGRAYAEHLAGLGADVVVHDEAVEAAAAFGEAEDIEVVADAIRSVGRRSLALAADVTDPGAVDRMVDEILRVFGHIDILVNNAGGDIGVTGRPDPNDGIAIAAEDVQAVVNRNLVGTIHCCRSVVPHMMERRFGSIVNVGSTAGVTPTKVGIAYAAAKAGIIHYTRCLAQQLRPFDIRVNAISPGPTVTARFLATRHVPPEQLQASAGLRRLGQPVDQARVLEFLVTDLAEYVTGQNLVVDGGCTFG